MEQDKALQVLHDLCEVDGIMFDHYDEMPDEIEKKVCRYDPYSGKVVFYEVYAEFSKIKDAVYFML